MIGPIPVASIGSGSRSASPSVLVSTIVIIVSLTHLVDAVIFLVVTGIDRLHSTVNFGTCRLFSYWSATLDIGHLSLVVLLEQLTQQ